MQDSRNICLLFNRRSVKLTEGNNGKLTCIVGSKDLLTIFWHTTREERSGNNLSMGSLYLSIFVTFKTLLNKNIQLYVKIVRTNFSFRKLK